MPKMFGRLNLSHYDHLEVVGIPTGVTLNPQTQSVSGGGVSPEDRSPSCLFGFHRFRPFFTLRYSVYI